MKFERASGILLHPTSLPGNYGIGSLGKEAFQFIDFLKESGQSLWQILPLGPTGFADSPYQCFSAFAGNGLLIDIDTLIQTGFLTIDNIQNIPIFSEDEVEYDKIIEFKYSLYEIAFYNFLEKANIENKNKFDSFCMNNHQWLDDYAFFISLKNLNDKKPWYEWEYSLKFRDLNILKKYKKELEKEIQFNKFLQYLFFEQWNSVKIYANQSGVKIIGDIPLYVAFDSVEAWKNPELFLFDEKKLPEYVAGVPPDYFSETGQLWGNPIYNWNRHKHTGFKWWIERVKSNLEMFDILRIDHFRGLAAYWSIPFGEETAVKGEWIKAPGKELFTTIKNELGELPIIAEDLGLITEDVVELRDNFGFPGMKILQFAFDSFEENNYLPHTFDKNCAVYTGTHDNDTTMGWYNSTYENNRKTAQEYLNFKDKEVHFEFIRTALASVADIAIIPMQDILGLGTECRMNIPGTVSGNWKWRLRKNLITPEIIEKLKKLSIIYGRFKKE